MHVKHFQQFFHFFRFDQIAGTFILKPRPYCTVDMIGNQCHILLCVTLKSSAFRNDITDKLMILFNVRLLPGCLRITVKKSGSGRTGLCVFKCHGILEASSVICQDYRKQFSESFDPQYLRKRSNTSITGSMASSLIRIISMTEVSVNIRVSSTCSLLRSPLTVSISTTGV